MGSFFNHVDERPAGGGTHGSRTFSLSMHDPGTLQVRGGFCTTEKNINIQEAVAHKIQQPPVVRPA